MPDADDADPSIRYRIDGEIARGGMGAVLKGRDPDLGRDVALKVLRDDLRENADMVRRFVEEAQIGGQLQHPGVVPIYELGTFADRRPFFAMKLVKGHTLAELLADRQGPADDLPRFLSIFEAICQTDGLRPRPRRDPPRPEAVERDGRQLRRGAGDGLGPGQGPAPRRRRRRCAGRQDRARGDRDRHGPQRLGRARPVPRRLASWARQRTWPPSRRAARSTVIDERADVFALGSILCEILTGEPGLHRPRRGRDPAQGGPRRHGRRLARLDACGADAELIALAKDCLAREPEDRPRDASAVAERITAYLASVQERLRRAELTSLEERTRRRLTTVAAASVLALMALGVGGWLWVKNDRDSRVAALTRDVNDALNKATLLRAQASSATTGAGLLFGQAREQAQRALALVENGPADAALRQQVTQVQADLDQEEKDRQLLIALDEARLAQVEMTADKNYRFGFERAMPLFREAFRAYGLTPGEGEPKVAAERVRHRPAAVREAILATLDEWDGLAGDPMLGITEPHREWLRGVLEAAEPAEGWMRQFRAARGLKDEGRRKTALVKLATAENVGTLPVRTLTRLADQLEK